MDLAQLQDPAAVAGLLLPLVGNVVAALAIFFIGRWVAGALTRVLRKAFDRGGMDNMLSIFLTNVIYGLALAVIVIAALGQLGIDTTSAAALVGGAALAVGLSLQSQLASFAAGVMMIIFKPFKIGDFIQAGGVMGVVEEIKIVHIMMKTLDNQEVIVPNARVWSDTITNFSARPTRRVDLAIGISYGSDLRQAKAILERLLKEEPRMLEEPAPSVMVTGLGESSVDFAVRGFTERADWWATRCDLLERIKLTFDAEGIEIPFPQRDVHVRDLPSPMAA
jgi:small conductance mechanosensitive channel